MRKILSALRKGCEDFDLIDDGDKIAVGISGGKDSVTLLYALSLFQKFSPKKFDIVAIAVDLSGGKINYNPLIEFCEKNNIKLDIVPSNVFEIVFDIRKEKNPCSLCANLRRGLLNSRAKELGCNKVALGHHKDDFIETFLLSLFYEGRLSTFKPKTYLSRIDLQVIRPLIYCWEKDIESASKILPIIKNPCPVDKHTKREESKLLLKEIENNHPNAKEKIFNAIIHPERYNLFEKK